MLFRPRLHISFLADWDPGERDGRKDQAEVTMGGSQIWKLIEEIKKMKKKVDIQNATLNFDGNWQIKIVSYWKKK